MPKFRAKAPAPKKVVDPYTAWLKTIWHFNHWARDQRPAEERRKSHERMWSDAPFNAHFDSNPPWFEVAADGPNEFDPNGFGKVFKEERRRAGDIVVELPGTQRWFLFHPGTPQFRIEREIVSYGVHAGRVTDYAGWRAIVASAWPTTPEGQDEARGRNSAYWAETTDSLYHALVPPRYFETGVHRFHRYLSADAIEPWEQAFLEERRRLGDTVIGNRIFDIGTPEAQIARVMALGRVEWTAPAVVR